MVKYNRVDRRVPRICVLLAACNGSEWLEEQVSSILEQAEVDVSIFISVDTSRDSTLEIATQLSVKHSSVVLITRRKGEAGAAQNFFHLLQTVDFLKYDAVALSDQDDIWLPSKLRSAWHFLECEGFDAYSSDVLAFWESKSKVKLIRKSSPQTPYDFLFEAGGPGCTYVISSTRIEELKKYLVENNLDLKSIRYHDFFIYSFGRWSGWRWKIESGGYLLYRQHSRNYLGANYGILGVVKRFQKSIWSDFIVQVNFNLKNFCDPGFKISFRFILNNFFILRRNWWESSIISLFFLIYQLNNIKRY